MKILAQLEARVGEWVANLQLAPETPLDIAEQMAVQFLQYFGKVKEQQADMQKKAVTDHLAAQEGLQPPLEVAQTAE